MASLTEPSYIIYDSAVENHEPNSILGIEDGLTSKGQKFQDPRNASSLGDLFVDFLDNYIPREKAESPDEHKSPGSWLRAIARLQGSHTSLDLAMSALSMVRLGRKRGDEELRREGTATYGRALRWLQDILSNDTLIFEEQTLASCITLSIFEASTLSRYDYMLLTVWIGARSLGREYLWMGKPC